MSATNKDEVILEINVKYAEALRAISQYQTDIEELTQKQKDYARQIREGQGDEEANRDAMNAAAAAIKERKGAVRVLNKELQNNMKIEREGATTIDALKAKLSNLTAEYNKMSEAERRSSKGNSVQQEIGAVTTKLNEEEQALGNFRRQVGNYEVATKSLRGELRDLTEQLAQMKVEGKDGTAEYAHMAKRASEFQDAMGDVRRQIGEGASDTLFLDHAKQSADALAGSFTLLNSVQGMFTDNNERMQVIIQKVQLGIGALSAATALQNAFQKEGIIMQGIYAIKAKAATAATALQTKGTVAATVTQRIFNAVAGANPYVLLAMALITVVGALAAFAFGTEDTAEKQKKLNERQSAYLDALESEGSRIKEVSAQRVAALERELRVAQSKQNNQKEIWALEDKILHEKRRAIVQNMGEHCEEIAMLEENKKQLESQKKLLEDINVAKSKGRTEFSLKINGKVKNIDIDKAADMVQGQVDNYGRKVEFALGLQDDLANNDAEEEAKRNQRAKQIADAAKQARQKELEAVRQAQDAVLSLLKEGKDKAIQQTQLQYARQIADLKAKINTEEGLTKAAKTAMDNSIAALEQKQKQEIKRINDEYSEKEFKDQVDRQARIIEAKLTAVKEGSETEYQLRMQQLQLEMQEELEANSRLEEAKQIDSVLIVAKYMALQDAEEAARRKTIAEKQTEAMRTEWENTILEAQLRGDGELEAKLAAKQAEIASLTQLDEESDAEYMNRKLTLAAQEKALMQDVADAEQQKMQDTLSAFGGLANSMGQIFEMMGEDNEAMAAFSKLMALFEIGLNTAKAISAATASGAKLGIGGIIATVATVIANIAQATQILNSLSQPKAPKVNKYASGGSVFGPGSGTSDSVQASLSNGESVMTALTTQMFGPLLSSFNQIGGGVPLQVQNASAQVIGEDMLARAFAKGAAALPPPRLALDELGQAQGRLATIEQLRQVG